ncbi:MAG: hypothetical protein HUU22_18465 [Phycisphaerae bacterium]|nr:hypothetical protein [Phycisphaerae bacterium]
MKFSPVAASASAAFGSAGALRFAKQADQCRESGGKMKVEASKSQSKRTGNGLATKRPPALAGERRRESRISDFKYRI